MVAPRSIMRNDLAALGSIAGEQKAVPTCGDIAGRLIRIAESKHRLMPHEALLPTDTNLVDKISTLPDDHFQELLADGTIHPKMKRATCPL